MPFHIYLHPIRDTSPFSPQLAEDPAIGQHPIGPYIESLYMSYTSEYIISNCNTLGVIDVEDAFIWRKR